MVIRDGRSPHRKPITETESPLRDTLSPTSLTEDYQGTLTECELLCVSIRKEYIIALIIM